MKKILITVGGTGGHIYPAMALAKQLHRESHDLDILFVGGGLGSNRFFEREQLPYREVACGSFKKNPLKCISNAVNILQGTRQSMAILKAYRPNLVVGFGSFYTVPTLLAAKICDVPIILHEANRIPGKVNRFFSRFVKMTGIHFPDSGQHLSGLSCQAAIPLREGYQRNVISTVQARHYFHLNPQKTTILVFGGSQGAKAINRLCFEGISSLSQSVIQEIQVLHFTGDAEIQSDLQRKYTEKGITAHVKAFELRMDMAWQAADLVVSRAGAGTIAELCEFEVPGILIPYPHAADNHQESNADFMVETVGGATKYLEQQLDGSTLGRELMTLLSDDQKRLKEMNTAIRKYKLLKPQPEFYKIILDSL